MRRAEKLNMPVCRRVVRLARRGRLLLLALVCAGGGALLCAPQDPARAAVGDTTADIAVTKSGDESAPLGGQISYIVTVSNAGPDAATNVVLTDPIPEHTTFVNASVSQGTVMFDGTTVTANFGTIGAPSGEDIMSATLSLTVSVNSDTPRGTVISNTATATTTTTDPDPDNDSATADTFVTGTFAGDVLISEFRFRGPTPSGTPQTGAFDEFIEIYNNTDSPVTVTDILGGSGCALATTRGAGNKEPNGCSSSPQGNGGWAVVTSDNTSSPKFVIPSGTVIPARGHYLGVNANGYSLNGYPAGTTINAVGDTTYTTDIPDNAGIAIFRTANPSGFNADQRLDAVGFSAVVNPLYREGNGLGLPVTTDIEHSFVRKLASGQAQDTDNNLADFALVATNGNQTLTSAQLGAPGPENLFSPTQHNADVKASLIEPQADSSAPPNRVRVGSGDSGTLSFRRNFKNATGAPVTRLRFRVVNITTLGTPVSLPSQADVRLITSDDFFVTTSRGDLTVHGTVIEEPPAQPAGGGLNSSATVFLPGGALAPGASIDVQLLLSVVRGGNYRFFINVEAVGTAAAPEKAGRIHKQTAQSRAIKAVGQN
jgi:uncharacterized repeat protein (TIGR01451 family)